MGDRFDPGKESCYLQYLDANNQYGWAMSQNLPTGGFKLVANPEKLKDHIGKLAKKQGKGYLLEADMSYHCNLHHLHNDLLFMFEKMKINGIQKLVPNLFNKKKHIIHTVALDQALRHGLVLQQIHEFEQNMWFVLYIEFNIQLHEKDFFKLMNNSVFRKTMENIRKHRDMNLYHYMKLKYGMNLQLCYMDTDSLIYNIKTDDFYEDIASNLKARFDMSGYSHSCPLPMGVNKKVRWLTRRPYEEQTG